MSDPLPPSDKVADWLAAGPVQPHRYLHCTFDARFIVQARTPFKTVAVGEGNTLAGALEHLATQL